MKMLCYIQHITADTTSIEYPHDELWHLLPTPLRGKPRLYHLIASRIQLALVGSQRAAAWKCRGAAIRLG